MPRKKVETNGLNKLLENLNEEQIQALAKALEGYTESYNKKKLSVPKPSPPKRRKTNEGQPRNPRKAKDVKVKGGEVFTGIIRKEDDAKGRTPVKAGKNKWKDTLEDRNIKTPPIKGERATRKPVVKKVTKKCHVCNRDIKVHPDYVFGEFLKCDRCIRK